MLGLVAKHDFLNEDLSAGVYQFAHAPQGGHRVPLMDQEKAALGEVERPRAWDLIQRDGVDVALDKLEVGQAALAQNLLSGSERPGVEVEARDTPIPTNQVRERQQRSKRATAHVDDPGAAAEPGAATAVLDVFIECLRDADQPIVFARDILDGVRQWLRVGRPLLSSC